jgi:aspartate racemase
MEKIGLIGGLGPEATIQYYRGIAREFSKLGYAAPEIIVYSADLNRLFALMEGED